MAFYVSEMNVTGRLMNLSNEKNRRRGEQENSLTESIMSMLGTESYFTFRLMFCICVYTVCEPGEGTFTVTLIV